MNALVTAAGKFKILRGVALLAIALGSANAGAAETITYSYDAKGRLVRVVHTGSVNNNLTTEYTHDKANNRKTTKTTGAKNLDWLPAVLMLLE